MTNERIETSTIDFVGMHIGKENSRPMVRFDYETDLGIYVHIKYTKDYPVEEGYAPTNKGTLKEWDVAVKVSGDQHAGGNRLLKHVADLQQCVAHHYNFGHDLQVLRQGL